VLIFPISALVVNGEVSQLLCIHAWCRDLNWASEVKVVVAQMVGRCLNLILSQASGVVDNLVMNWLSRGNSCLVRD